MSTNDAIQTVTDEEMREFGFDPECPMISQRLPGWPVKLRHNDDLVERYESGGISVWMGFFTESQIAYRRILGRIMCEKFETGTLQARIEMERENLD